MANIAVIDVAADGGGALSVLSDFIHTLKESKTKHQWYIFTSVVEIEETPTIHNLVFPEVKKSWLYRLYWENMMLPGLLRKKKIAAVLSLQNGGVPVGSWTQFIYFHNIILLQKRNTFSFIKKEERRHAIYLNLIGTYVRWTLSRAQKIFVQANHVKDKMCVLGINQVSVIRPNVPETTNIRQKGKIRGYIYPTPAKKYKNIEYIFEAERILNSRGEKIDVLLTIDQDDSGYAKKLYNEAKDLNGITFIGRQERNKLIAMYEDYGLVITSRFESFPIPIAEAINCGTVIVALNYPYAKELLERYNRAYIAERPFLAEALEKGMKDQKEAIYYQKEYLSYQDMIQEIEGCVMNGEG